MRGIEELFQIADRLQAVRDSGVFVAHEGALEVLNSAAANVGRAFSGSWLGYHANVYYRDLIPPPPGAHFSQEWGLQRHLSSRLGSSGEWVEFSSEEISQHIKDAAGNPDLTEISQAASEADEIFKSAKSDIRSILLTEGKMKDDQFIEQLLSDLDKLQPMTADDIAEVWSPKGQIMTRDTTAVGQGTKIPPT